MKEKESERFEKNIVSLTRIYLRNRRQMDITLHDIKLNVILHHSEFTFMHSLPKE